MASSSLDGPSSVRKTRSANDVANGAATARQTGGGGVGEGPSRAAAPVDGGLHPLGSSTGTSGFDEGGRVTSTTSILPTSSTSLDGATLKTSSSNVMEGSSASSSSNPTVFISAPGQRPQLHQMPTGHAYSETQGEIVYAQVHRPPPPEVPSHRQRLLQYFGYGGAPQARKTQVHMVQNLAWGFIQVTSVTILVSLSGTVWKSPTSPDQTEWDACDRPLGIWACLWVARAAFVAALEYWDYKRALARAALQQLQASLNAAENGTTVHTTTTPGPGTPSAGATGGLFPLTPTNPYEANNGQNANDQPQINLPYTLLYQRLTLFSSLITLSWFLTAHILVYTSLGTCRHTAPHLWWTLFACICIMYMMLLEVVALGFLVIIVAPVLFLFWNIFLLCMGRHPITNPHFIKPDVGKLPKSTVDRLPLVMYIPPPPEAASTPESSSTPAAAETSSSVALEAEPKEADIAEEITPSHQYPPTPAPQAHQQQQAQTPTQTAAQPTKRSRRFRFFRRKRKVSDEEDEDKKGDTTADPADPEKGVGGSTYEDQYEKGEHPFVILEGNRAACAICLMDFEPPKRKDEAAGGEVGGAAPTDASAVAQSPEAAASGGSTDPEQLRLEDSGEGAQPLRLLGCGHVFHQTCVDPWLTDVSGRCPVCQRKVEEADLLKKKRKRRQR